MSDTQQRLAPEAGRDRLLDLLIRLHIDGRRRLVADDDLRAAHEGARERHELPLAEGEVEAFLFHDAVEVDAAMRLVVELGVRVDEVGLAERGPELEVGVFVEGVEVGADRASEEGGVLRDDGQTGSQVVESDGGDVDAIDTDCSSG